MLEFNAPHFIRLCQKMEWIRVSIVAQPLAISSSLYFEENEKDKLFEKKLGSPAHRHRDALKKNKEASESLKQVTHEALGETLKEIADECIELGLQFSAIEVERAKKRYEEKETLEAADIQSISQRILDELKTHLFFQTKPENWPYYRASIKKWKDVTDKHPELIEDGDSAGRSIAFEMYTASVFHLMRIMERGLKLLGAKFGISDYEEKQWNTIVQNVRDEIEKKWPSHEKSLTSSEKELRQNYNESLAYLTAVKNAWRNSVMHPKDTYTQEEAINIYNAVLAFMKNLVSLT